MQYRSFGGGSCLSATPAVIIISIFVKRHKVVTSEALAAVGGVCYL